MIFCRDAHSPDVHESFRIPFQSEFHLVWLCDIKKLFFISDPFDLNSRNYSACAIDAQLAIEKPWQHYTIVSSSLTIVNSTYPPRWNHGAIPPPLKEDERFFESNPLTIT